MYKIAVMGDRDSIYGFASVGLDIFPESEPSSAGKLIKTLTESGYAIIYMTEALYSVLEKELAAYKELPLPAIIPIPGVSGNTGIGISQIKKSVEKAVGSDILFGGG
jgi:V/A-type H+-transporting ATPase subunit F